MLKRGRVRRAPVPIEKLAAILGVEIRYRPFSGELYGMVHRGRDGSAVIGVNSSDATSRQRFTVAHELGHLLLHEDTSLHIDERFPIGLRTRISGLAVDEREVEANQFAAELLMPLEFVRKDVDFLRGTDVDVAIAKLARKYKVSIEAMTIRLSALRFVEL